MNTPTPRQPRVALTPTRVEPGDELAGHRVLRALGAGGFGAVFEAVDLTLDRRVALKVLTGAHPVALVRFREEARLLARIDDPHVVRVHHVAQAPDGAPVLVMELFGDGALTRHVPRGEAADPGFAVNVVAQLLRALVAAHDEGVIHRDIKEANILVDGATGLVKLCDFGIARASDEGFDLTGRAVVGTPHYIAPERLQGVRDDPRLDLYSVGVVFYRLLTGRRPFEGEASGGADLARRAGEVDAPAPEGVPPALAAVCMRMIARDPDARPRDARDALLELMRAWTADPGATLPNALASLPPGMPTLVPGRRRRWLRPAAAAAMVFAAAAWTVRAAPPAPERMPVALEAPAVDPPPLAVTLIPDAEVRRAPSVEAPPPTAKPSRRAVRVSAAPPRTATLSRRPSKAHGDPFVVDPARAPD